MKHDLLKTNQEVLPTMVDSLCGEGATGAVSALAAGVNPAKGTRSNGCEGFRFHPWLLLTKLK